MSMLSPKINENKIDTPLVRDDTENTEYSVKTKKGVFRKIKKGKKNNYIYENKTSKWKFKQKQFSWVLEQIYSRELDNRFETLILRGYDYMSNILSYEIHEAEWLFLTERIIETAYFIFLNYILIEWYSNKKQFFLDLKKWKIERQEKILKLLNLIWLDINNFSNSTSFFNTFTDFWLFELDLSDKKIKEIESVFSSELAYIKINIIYNRRIYIVKEKKNLVWKEIQTIILNLYDYLFLLFYIINFTQELAFILGKESVKKIKGKMKDYWILLSEDEFLLIIEILIVFYLKWYKKYLYKNYNFIAAINEIVLKVYKELKYKKWVPNKSNFKSWLANWSKNFIKQFISEEVRPIEEEEKMATIYNNLEYVLTEQLKNTKKEINDKDKNEKIKLITELDDIEDWTEEYKEEIPWTDSEFDSTILDSLKRNAININNINNWLSEKWLEVSERIEKIKKIYNFKKNIEKLDDKELKEKINIQKLDKISKEELIKFIKIIFDDINNYIYNKNEYLLDEDLNRMLEDIYDLKKLTEIQLYSFLQGILEISIWKTLPNNIDLKKVIQSYLTLNNMND